jgi:hypothetical protein
MQTKQLMYGTISKLGARTHGIEEKVMPLVDQDVSLLARVRLRLGYAQSGACTLWVFAENWDFARADLQWVTLEDRLL